MTLGEIYRKGMEILEGKKFGFVLRGVETEYVIKHNEEIFRNYRFLQRAINSIDVTTETRLLDVNLKVPIIMSSMTMPITQIQHNGLIKVARALKETGSMMWVGSPIPSNLKELVAIGVPIVQTIKPFSDRAKVMEMLSQAEMAGVTWLGIEVDAGQGTKVLDKQVARDCSPMSVDELKEIKRSVSRPFVLKGILSPWDAESALKVGADVIVVSIIVDGGFRRGSDILKGLAFGAQAVGLGRPILYGLAAGGEEGVRTLITELAEELRRAMTMTGVKDPSCAHQGIILQSSQ